MAQIQCLDSKIEHATSILAKLCIEPLTKGQGVTVGNALRRTLLSDIPIKKGTLFNFLVQSRFYDNSVF